MWPGGTWVSWVQIQDHPPTASASVLRFPGGEWRVLGAEDAEVASSQAFSQIHPTNSPFPAAKGAPAAARASRVSTPSPRSRWGSRQFSYPFSCRRFGHPGPEVNGKVQAPDKRRDPSLPPPAPVDAKVVIFPFYISICHRNKAARRFAGREKRAGTKG